MPIKKKPKQKLTLKQRKFADEYIKTGNATEAASRVYNVKSRSVAKSVGPENLAKPCIIEYLKDNAAMAASFMTSVIENDKDKTSDRINAAKDVLDRAGYKPTEKRDDTLTVKDEELTETQKQLIIDQYIKKHGR